ncbi:ubiquitin-conjugating enzyme E2 U [Mus pahari]|uniref:ubiquitin-conjugating enzyme E2 U n=1 Tax=Mus pahari TaxID=10093 RepID=UPI000A306506|nr:ubiquitin-conjugating enzyme E2 U [Mus pahari]
MGSKTGSNLTRYSKAYILLERDFKELQHNARKDITAYPVSDDKMNWKAEIEGLRNSVCEGLVFYLALEFSREYNSVPPVVKFITIPFHPNVDPYTGKPSIDFLDNPDKWNTSYTVLSILLDLQMLLSYPDLKNPVNFEAAQLLIRDESTYKLVIRELLPPASPKREGSLVVAAKPQEYVRVIKTISFNDYYKTWSQIATTKVAEHSRNPFAGDPHFMGQYYKWKQQDRQNQVQWESKFALSKWQTARKKVMAQEKSNRYNRMLRVYPSLSELSFEYETEEEPRFYQISQEWSEGHDSKESWEEEADHLVSWTNGLDEESLNDEYYDNIKNYENVGN